MGLGLSTAGGDRRPVIAVVGEVVADAVAAAPEIREPDGAPAADRSHGVETLSLTVHPGGSPANVALGIARLGSVARFAGRFSTGTLGRLCRARLAASGVDLRASVDVTQPATLAITSLGPDGGAEYEFYTDGTADWGWQDAELDAVLHRDAGPTPVAVHTGSLALALAPSGARIESLLNRARAACTVSIDPNLRTGLVPVTAYRDAIDRWASIADIVKLSADDLAALWPGVGSAEAATRLHGKGAALVVVTDGGRGSFASLRSDRGSATVEIPAVATAVADTVGAGDSFTAGLLHHLAAAGALGGRLAGLDRDVVISALTFAGTVAAKTCSRPGADPPWAAELG